MSASEQEARALWPKPAVGQRWVYLIDGSYEAISITKVEAEGDFPVSFTWETGGVGAWELDMHDFEPARETWAAHLLAERSQLDAANARADGARAAALREAAVVIAMLPVAGVANGRWVVGQSDAVAAIAAIPTPPASAATTGKETRCESK